MIEPWFKLTWFDFRLSINIKNSIIIIKTRVVPQLWSVVCSICIHGNKMDFFFSQKPETVSNLIQHILCHVEMGLFVPWEHWTGLGRDSRDESRAAWLWFHSDSLLLFRALASACAFPTGNSSGKDYCFFLVIRASRIIGRCLWVLTLLQQLLTCSHSQQWKML